MRAKAALGHRREPGQRCRRPARRVGVRWSVRRGRRTVSCGATHIALEGLHFIADGVGGGALVPRDKVSVEVRHGLSERDRIHAQAAGEFELLLLDVPDSEAEIRCLVGVEVGGALHVSLRVEHQPAHQRSGRAVTHDPARVLPDDGIFFDIEHFARGGGVRHAAGRRRRGSVSERGRAVVAGARGRGAWGGGAAGWWPSASGWRSPPTFPF